jgi:hypothetical protein
MRLPHTPRMSGECEFRQTECPRGNALRSRVCVIPSLRQTARPFLALRHRATLVGVPRIQFPQLPSGQNRHAGLVRVGLGLRATRPAVRARASGQRWSAQAPRPGRSGTRLIGPGQQDRNSRQRSGRHAVVRLQVSRCPGGELRDAREARGQAGPRAHFGFQLGGRVRWWGLPACQVPSRGLAMRRRISSAKPVHLPCREGWPGLAG